MKNDDEFFIVIVEDLIVSVVLIKFKFNKMCYVLEYGVVSQMVVLIVKGFKVVNIEYDYSDGFYLMVLICGKYFMCMCVKVGVVMNIG